MTFVFKKYDKVLWTHIFTVELIKKKFEITTENAKKNFLDQIWDKLDRFQFVLVE